jgi:hypothetical protein
MLLDIADLLCHRHNLFVDKEGNFQACAIGAALVVEGRPHLYRQESLNQQSRLKTSLNMYIP